MCRQRARRPLWHSSTERGCSPVCTTGEEEEKKKKKKGKGGEGKAEHKEQQPVGEREYSVVFQRMAYHEFREAVTAEEDGGDGSDSDLAAAPDLVLAFNSGIADYRYEHLACCFWRMLWRVLPFPSISSSPLFARGPLCAPHRACAQPCHMRLLGDLGAP